MKRVSIRVVCAKMSQDTLRMSEVTDRGHDFETIDTSERERASRETMRRGDGEKERGKTECTTL